MELLFGLNPIFFFQTIIGISFVVLGVLLGKYPPKKINHLYGYRTRSSMSSQERWNHAQAYSSREMILHGMITAALGVVLGLIPDVDTLTSVVLFVLILIASCAILVIRTEKSLRELFK